MAELDRGPGTVLANYLDQQPFVVRHWLADLVDERLREPTCRHVLITADAGMGKSSFLAWLTTRYPLAPYYFIRLDSLTPFGSADATHLLMSIGRQLAALCPEAMADQPLRISVDQHTGRIGSGGSAVGLRATRLIANPFRRTDIAVVQRSGKVDGDQVGIEVDEVVDSEWLLDIATLQRLALLDPAVQLARHRPGARVVLLIDGLDELRGLPTSPRWTIMDWLVNCPAMPDNLRVVATSRPDRALLRAYRLRQRDRLRELALTAGQDRVADDLAHYVDTLCRDDELRDALARRGVDLLVIARAAADRARGNFLYLTSWARAIRFAVTTGRWDEADRLVEGTVLPSSLTELYELFVVMLRSVTAEAWESRHWPVLAVLVVSQGPVTSRQLARMAGLADRATELALVDMPHFLRVDGGRFAVFHTSFAEYLQSEEARAALPEHWIDPAVTNRQTAARLIETYGVDWASCPDDYALANVVSHLVSALGEEQPVADSRWCAQALAALLADDGFLARKSAVAGVTRTLVDFAEAYNAARPYAADGFPELLARHTLRFADDRIDVDSLYAALNYRTEFDEFYGRLLDVLADLDFVAAHTPEGDNHELASRSTWADFAEILVHRLRRRGRLDAAAELLGRIADVRGEQSRALYERGYLHFLHGRVDEALDHLTESVDAARQAGNEVSAWMSRLVRDQIAFYADRVAADTYAAVLDEALVFFAAQSSHAHSERWLMNVHNQILTLAYLTGDVTTAARECAVLREDEWTRREHPWLVALWEARTAIVAEDWARAATLYEEMLGPDALDVPPPTSEGIAWRLLDYGRALAGTGRSADAVRAWQQVLRCADSTAAWPWKPRARALLADAPG